MESIETVLPADYSEALTGGGAARMGALQAQAADLWDDDPTRAAALATEAGLIADAVGDAVGVGVSLCLQGRSACQQGDADRAESLLRQGLGIGHASGTAVLEIDCLLGLGQVHSRRSEAASALACDQQALALAEAQGDQKRQAQALRQIGSLYFVLSDYDNALIHALASVRLSEAAGDERGKADSFNNIANTLWSQGDYTGALDQYRRCIEICRRTEQARLEGRGLCNIACTLNVMGRLDEAAEYAREALACARRWGHKDNECNAFMNLAAAHSERGEHGLAVPLYREALSLARSVGDGFSECEAFHLLGEAHLALGELSSARADLCRAARIGEERGFKHLASVAFKSLSLVCERVNAFPEALDYHKKYHELERQVFSEGADQRVKALMVQREVEKAQKEAETYQHRAETERLRGVELAEMNSALQEAGRQKSALVLELQAQAELLQAQAEELQAQAEDLHRQATRDSLTGLHNRRSSEEWLSRVFVDSRQHGTALTVVLADLDHFKQINDRFGHQTGDAVLVAVSKILQQSCRSGDLAARYGGEEFVLALPGMPAAAGQALCERIRHAVQDFPWSTIHPDLMVTMSLGLADDACTPDFERLLQAADDHLYQAKRAGRNRVSFQAC